MMGRWYLFVGVLLALSVAGNAQTFIYTKNSLTVEVTISNPCNGTLGNGTIIFRALSSGSGSARLVLISGPLNTVFPELTLNTTNANTYAYSPPAPQNGTYDFVVRDPLNDADVINTFTTSFDGVTLTALTPPVLQTNSLVNNSDCNSPSGQIIAEVTGGSRSPALSVPGSFEYNWTADVSVAGLAYFDVFDGSTPLDLASLLQVGGLPSGNYTLSVKDVYSTCTTTQIFTITDDFPVVQNLSLPAAPVCGAQDVNLLLSDSEGSGVTYEIFKDGVGTGVTTSGTGDPLTLTIPGLLLAQQGTYTFTVQATSGICKPVLMTGAAIITVPSSVELTSTPVNPSCPGDTDGTITLSATGGAGNYQYSIDQGLNYQASGNFTGLAAGTYKVYGKDGNGCTSLEGEVTLTDPQPVTFTATPVSPLCTGGSNGSVTLVGSGGNGTFQYSLNNGTSFQSSGAFSNLAAGVFNVVVKDSKGCSSAAGTVTVTDPTPVSGTATGTPPSCTTSNNGQILFTPAGGTGSYTYSVNNGTTFNSPNPVTGLIAGTYTLIIKDSNGCTASAGSVALTAPALVTLTSTKSDPVCNGQSTGSITLTGGGGSGTYTFSINNGSSFLSSGNFNNLAAGSYQAVVKDSNGCLSAATSLSLVNPSAVTRTATPTAVVCNGESNGSIAITAAGGAGGYTYSIDNGTNFAASSLFSNLAAGSYPVVVRDSKGCLSTAGSVAVSQPAALTFTAVTVDPGCTGASTASITLTASGGNGGFSYSINNGTSFQLTTAFTGLAAGTYTALVKDNKGCLSGTQSLTINNPTPVASTVASTAPTCNLSNNGIITITASGGAGGYTYSTNNGTSFSSGNPITGLAPGNYQVLAKDSKGCLSPVSAVTLTAPAAVTLTSVSTQPLCSGTLNGTITITGAGGTGTFTYSINGGAPYQVSNSFTGLGAGSYVLRVKDSNDCLSATTNVTLTSPSQVNVTASSNPTDCSNTATGSITLTGSGGNGPYTYSIDNGNNFSGSGIFGGLAGGSYTVLAKDANGCLSVTKSASVSAPSAVTFTTVNNAPACNGGATGSIAFTASGGNGIFNYSINNGTSFTGGNTFSNLSAGTYTLVVRDGKGCISATGSATLTDPLQVTFTATPTPVACAGNTNGSLAITAAGGNNSYTYSINNGTSFSTGSTFSNLAAGTYTVVVKDGRNCLSVPGNTTVTAPAALTINTALTQETCNNQGDGTITITAAGGNDTYTYSINAGGTFVAGASFTNLIAGTYSAVAKDNKGCLSPTTPVTLASRPALTFTFTQTPVTTCSPANEGSITLSAAGGTGTFSYSINNGTTTQSSASFSGLGAGSYSLIVRDNNNCSSAVQQATLQAPAGITATQSSSPASCSGTTDGSVTIQGNGGDNNYSYSIDNGTTFQTSGTFGNLASGTYTLTARDGRLCTATVIASVSQPEPLNLSASSTDITCNGKNDGIITLTATGGNGGYQYSVDNAATLASSGNFSGLAPGSYQLTLIDSKGCTLPAATRTLNEPTALSLTSSHTDVTNCTSSNDGTVDLSATGGTPGYVFSIDQISYSAATNFTALSPGIYNVAVRDANGCISAGTETILSADGPLLTFSVTGLTCFEDSTGALFITGSGGTSPLEYSVDGGSTYTASGTFSNLDAGSFALRVRDAGGCTFQASATVSQPDPVTASASATDITCNGLTDGIINLTGSGGSGIYEFAISGTSAFQASPAFSGLGAGSYGPVVRDDKGCLSSPATASITEPAAIAVTLTPVNPGCADNDGTIRLATLSGGTVPYSYRFNGNIVASLPANNLFTGLSSGTYAFEVTDANLCVKSVSTSISFPGNITASATTADPDCSGNGDNGKIDLTIGSAGSFQAGISTSATLPPAEFTPVTSAGIATTSFTGLTAGTYYLYLNETNLCPFRSTIIINAGPVPLDFELTATDQQCFEDAGKLVLSSVTGAAGLPYSLVITDGASTVLNRNITAAEASGNLNLQVPGQGSFQARLLQDQSSVNGCVTPIQTGLLAFSIDGPDASLDTLSTNPQLSLPDLPTGQLSGIIAESGAEPYESKLVLTTPAFPDQQYSSDFTIADEDDQTSVVGFQYQNLFAGIYTLTLKDGLGCEKDFLVSVAADPSLFIPNIFTPNGDGVNDTFYVRNLPAGTTMVVTNRWGKQVFASNSYNNLWSGEGQPDGIYYYRIDISGKTYTGWMELLRGK